MTKERQASTFVIRDSDFSPKEIALPKNVYEALFIFDSNKYARDAGGVSGQVTQILERHGGEILANRLWEERRLAYPINGQRKGMYWLTYFRLDSKALAPVEREFRLSESILRSLTLKVDPRIAEALVSHAISGTIAQTRPRKPEPAEAAAAPGGEEVPEVAEVG
jgi:small subunit ribosomal protein S6